MKSSFVPGQAPRRPCPPARAEGTRPALSAKALFVVVAWTAAARGGEIPAHTPPETVGQYQRWEIVLADELVRPDRDAHPLIPEQIRLDMTVTAPDGAETAVPGFYDAPVARRRAPGPWRPEKVMDGRFGIVLGERPTGAIRDSQPAIHNPSDPGAGDAGGGDEFGEYWEPDGVPVWRVRYTPTRAGAHRYRVAVDGEGGGGSGGKARVLAAGDFRVTAAPESARGFVRRHPALANRLRYDNGRAIFLIGHNVAWTGEAAVVGDYERYFEKMATAGENFVRIWCCTWSLGLETKRPHAYDLRRAAQLDAVLDAAGRRGLMVMLCLDNYHDFQYNWATHSPYASENGGPCRTRADFFADDAARRQYRARLRYLVARLGHHPALLAWELWNEQNYALTNRSLERPRAEFRYEDGPVPGSPVARDIPTAPPEPDRARDDYHLPWTRWAATELRALDAAHGHLITTSLGRFGHWAGLWHSPEMDIAQYHAYINSSDWLRQPLEQDGALLVAEAMAPFAAYGKPALLGEFGYMGEDNRSSAAEADPDGILLHNSLWAGLMSGQFGTPMWWWWDHYLDRYDLYRHYRALSSFVADVDWNAAYVPARGEASGLRAWSLTTPGRVLLWLQDGGSTWHARLRRAGEGGAGVARRAVVGQAVGESGRWRVEWFDTSSGTVRETVWTESAADGILRFESPLFRHDIAARAVRE